MDSKHLKAMAGMKKAHQEQAHYNNNCSLIFGKMNDINYGAIVEHTFEPKNYKAK